MSEQKIDHNGPAVQRFLESMPIFALFDTKVVNFAAGQSELEMPWRHDPTFNGIAIPATVARVLLDFAGGSAAATLLPVGFEHHDHGV